MTECYILVENDGAPVRCDNCGWEGEAADLDMVSDIQERITPGYEVPAGQCPEEGCGALAYLTEPDEYTLSARFEVLKNRSEALLNFVRLFVDPTTTLPGGGTTTVDRAKLKEDAAKLLATIED